MFKVIQYLYKVHKKVFKSKFDAFINEEFCIDGDTNNTRVY